MERLHLRFVSVGNEHKFREYVEYVATLLVST